jgi:hypothetical protein
MSWAGQGRNACWGLVGNCGGKGALGISKCWWEEHFKIYFNQIETEGIGLICLTYDRNRWTVIGEYSNKPFSLIKYREFLNYVSCYCLLRRDCAV